MKSNESVNDAKWNRGRDYNNGQSQFAPLKLRSLAKVSLRLGYPWPLFLQGLRVSARRKCQAAFEHQSCSAASTLAGSASQTLAGSRGAAVPAAGAESVGHLSRWGPFMTATHCAGAPASRSWPSTSIRLSVPVREHRHLPNQRHPTLPWWAVPAHHGQYGKVVRQIAFYH